MQKSFNEKSENNKELGGAAKVSPAWNKKKEQKTVQKQRSYQEIVAERNKHTRELIALAKKNSENAPQKTVKKAVPKTRKNSKPQNQFQKIKNSNQIENWLLKQGFSPIRKEKQEWIYESPFENENYEISVNIEKQLWTFSDKDKKGGGSVIDLAMKMHRLSNSEALEVLKNKDARPLAWIADYKAKHQGDIIEIKQNNLLQNTALISQLQEQYCISPTMAKAYLQEYYYLKNGVGRQNGKTFFSFGFSTTTSFELTSLVNGKAYKMLVGKKNYHFIKGKTSGKILNVFADMFDFLACMELINQGVTGTSMQLLPNFDSLILNDEIKLLDKAEMLIKRYETVNSFLKKSFDCAEWLEKLSKINAQTIDRSKKYTAQEYNSFSAWWIGKKNGYRTQEETLLLPNSEESLFKLWAKFPNERTTKIYSRDLPSERENPPKRGMSIEYLRANYPSFRNLEQFAAKGISSGLTAKAMLIFNQLENFYSPSHEKGEHIKTLFNHDLKAA